MQNLKSSCDITSIPSLCPDIKFFRGRSEFMVKGWSDEVEDTKFQILGSNYLQIQVDDPIPIFFFFCHLTLVGEIMVNGWSDEVEDAKYEILG